MLYINKAAEAAEAAVAVAAVAAAYLMCVCVQCVYVCACVWECVLLPAMFGSHRHSLSQSHNEQLRKEINEMEYSPQ